MTSSENSSILEICKKAVLDNFATWKHEIQNYDVVLAQVKSSGLRNLAAQISDVSPVDYYDEPQAVGYSLPPSFKTIVLHHEDGSITRGIHTGENFMIEGRTPEEDQIEVHSPVSFWQDLPLHGSQYSQ